MAKKDKKPKKNKKKDDKPGSARVTALLIVGSLLMIIFLQKTYILFVIGILPTIVAYYVDRTPSRQIFHTVMPCNLSGVLPFVVELAIRQQNQSGALQSMLGDFTVLLIMYASAAFGWILVYAAPHMASLVIEALNNRQIRKLKKSQQSLVNEWGDEVARIDGEAA